MNRDAGRAAGSSGRLARNVVLLGVVSFFADVSSDMVMPLLPAFLVSLGAGAAYLGVVEGAAEATAAFLKYLSGRWADRVRRLLPLAVLGYALAALARPFLAISSAPWQVLLLRNIDRVGKGIRTSPRDKLLASSTAPARLAEAFAFHRGMDHAGAALGPLLAAALLLLWPGDLRRVFLLAAVPGALAVFALFAVRERDARQLPAPEQVAQEAPAPEQVARERQRAAGTARPMPELDGRGPPGARGETAGRIPKGLLLAIGVFTLGNSTDALLLLRAQMLGVPPAQLPLLWALLHAVRSLSSWPLGRAADRLGRTFALGSGWLWYAACYAGFAAARSSLQIWLLFAAYGLVAGLTEGSERALIAAAVPEQDRGRALGLYNLVAGAGLLLASILAGLVWERASPQAALFLGAALATLAAASLAAARRPLRSALAR